MDILLGILGFVVFIFFVSAIAFFSYSEGFRKGYYSAKKDIEDKKWKRCDFLVKFYDTNALLLLKKEAFKDFFYCSSQTLIEIENIKTSSKKDESTKFNAREVSRLFKENKNYEVIFAKKTEIEESLNYYNLEETPDLIIIIGAALLSQKIQDELIFVTNDISCANIAKNIFYLKTEFPKINYEEYSGYKRIHPSLDEYTYFLNNLNTNIYQTIENEYVIMQNEQEGIQDLFRWTNSEYKRIINKPIDSKWLGKIRARNIEQQLAVDLLQNTEVPIKILTGKYGVGRNLCRR